MTDAKSRTRLAFRWKADACFLGDMYVGWVDQVPGAWRWHVVGRPTCSRRPTKAEAQRALEDHVAAQTGAAGSAPTLRPMDEAPRDGTWILAYPPSDEAASPIVVQWVTRNFYHSWRTWENNHKSGLKDGGFAGWLPLPEVGNG